MATKTTGMGGGALRHRVQLQAPVVQIDDETGEPVITDWIDKGTPVWAAVEPVSGREWLLSAEFREGVTTRIRVRWRDDIDSTWRVIHARKSGETIYNIDAVLPRYEGMSELHLMCSSGVATQGGQP
ncbi:phage head closure protein [Caballeronia sp. LP003]|uniref:phage head closure protein n=1 Tax=Caballeronia sp. LP003 TaxID=3038551 RepID=UPI002854C7AF|nr:phage head closure protein [Caballeronia sp. LP003]MDR5790283.1 phage head closure protein [Caballeronia sp. LP003]